MTRPKPDRRTGQDLPDPTPPHASHLIGLLADCAQFLRSASPAVHDELHAFLTDRGHHPITGLPAFLNQLQFAAHRNGHIS